jgi:hypothetical protein
LLKVKKNGSYIWDEFIAEYKLNLEISHAVGSFFQTGRQKNLIAASSRMQEEPRLIINMGRVLLAKITVRKMKKPIEKINKGVRIFLAKIRRNRIR